MQLQIVEGIPMYVVELPDNPKSLLPIRVKWQPRLRLYVAALNIAIRTDMIREAGKYGITVDKAANNWHLHRFCT